MNIWKCLSLFDIQTYWWMCRMSRRFIWMRMENTVDKSVRVYVYRCFYRQKVLFPSLVSWICRTLTSHFPREHPSFCQMDHFYRFFFLCLFYFVHFSFYHITLIPKMHVFLLIRTFYSFIHSYFYVHWSSFTLFTHIHIIRIQTSFSECSLSTNQCHVICYMFNELSPLNNVIFLFLLSPRTVLVKVSLNIGQPIFI